MQTASGDSVKFWDTLELFLHREQLSDRVPVGDGKPETDADADTEQTD